MKICSTCKETKDTTHFYYKKTENRYQSMCKQCFSKYCTERWIKRKLFAIQYKGGECKICGYKKYFGALEFHHRNPDTKTYSWEKMRLLSTDKLLLELDKCDLLCANCHREVHSDELRAELITAL